MTINRSPWLLALMFSVAITACHQNSNKPNTVAAHTLDINNAVIHKSPNDDRSYSALLLPNQLQVVLVSDPSLENSAASLAVHVGSAQDPLSQLGLAHYCEHMLFLGTEKYPEPDFFMGFVQKNSGMTNAFTAFEKTQYLFQINAGKFSEALDIFSDYFKSPTFDPKFADKERNAVNAEWSKNHDQDGSIVNRVFGLTANPQNPKANFSTGNLETLSDKKNSTLQDELKAFYGHYYSANNMRLTLVGKQSIPELKALAEKYFSDIPNKNIISPQVTRLGITPAQMGKIIQFQSIQDTKTLMINFPIKNNKTDWRTKPNQLLGYVLGSEEEGALSSQLHKAGLINTLNVSTVSDFYGPDGFLSFEIDMTELGLKNRDAVIASIFSYVNLVKRVGIDEIYFRELQAVKTKAFLNAGKQNPLQTAIGLTGKQFDFPVENIVDSDFVYDHFDAQAVNNVLQQLDPTKARIWFIGKNESANTEIPYYGGKYDVRDITDVDRARWDALGKDLTFTLPPPNNLFTDKPAAIVDNLYIKPHSVVSEKGIEIYLQHPEFYREDKGVLDVELNVPFAERSAKNLVLAYLLSDIYSLKNTSLIDRATHASLHVNAAVGTTGSQFINIAGYTTKHEELLSLMLSGFATLNISDKDFSDALDRYKEGIANHGKAQLYLQAGEHAKRLQGLASWTDADLLAAAKTLAPQDLKNYHQSIKNNLLVRIFAFGNYSEATIKHMANTVTAQLPGSRLPAERRIAQYIVPKAGSNISYTEKVNLADSAVVDTYVSDQKSYDERANASVLSALYHTEFFKQLRTEEQLGYAVQSFASSFDEHAEFTMLVQSANLDAAGIKARMDKFRREFLAQLQSVNSDQIEQIKKTEAASILQKPTDFYREAKRYDGDFWTARFAFDSRDRYVAALEKVDKESLLAFYQKILLDKKSMNMLVQLQGTRFKDKPFAAVKP